MAVLYANNATTTLAASITGAATSFSVASGKGALFPAISGSDYFYVTLANAAGTIEIVKVTARSVDTFTVVRGQDGTAAAAWAAGDKVDLRITKAMLDDIKTDTKSSLSSANVTTALGYTPYNSTNPAGYITSSGTAANTYRVLTYDLRSTALTPGYFGQGLNTAFMANSTDGLSDGGSYHGIIQFQQWSDASGGGAAEIAITDNNNVWHRGSSGGLTTWSTWYKFLDSGNYNSYSPTLTGTGASGTWGISITGSAASITGTYGGTLTSTQVTNALGYTPYNSTNPSGYITASSSITGYSYGISVLDTDRTIANRLPTSTGQSVRFDFANASAVGTGGNYAGVMTFSPWTGTTGSTGDASYQLVFGSTATHGSGTPRLRLRNGIDSTWNAWYDVFTWASLAAQNGWTPIVSGGVTRISQTMWAKTGGNNAIWDGQLYSAEAYPTQVYCQASFGNTTGFLMFGLNTLDGTTDTDSGYAVIDFAWYGNNGTLQIYESGTAIASYGSYTASTVLTITYDGSNIRYYKDGSLQRTVARATGNGLYFDSSFYNNNSSSQLYNIQFGRLDPVVQSSGPVVWGAGSSIMNSGNPRSLAIGYSGGNYGSAGYGINYTTTSNSHTYAIADIVSRWDAYDGLVVYAAPSGTVGASVSWTTVLDARRSNSSLVFKGNTVLDSSNYTSYSPSLTGTGASGTWGISITGNAATATTAANYLPLAGGTLTGGLTGTSLTLSSTLQLGGSGTNAFTTGTGDGADYTTHNFCLSGWYGMGFYNPTVGGSYPNQVSGYLNFREGILDMKGGFRVNGAVVLNSSNYTSYSPSLTGTGASGTWGISITGNSATTSQTNFSTLTVASNTVLTTANIGSYAAVNVADGCMQTNNKTIANNYTLGSTTNAVSAGPITINTGVTVTISTGATWVVV